MAFQKPSHTFTKIHLKALHTNNFKILFALSFTVFINTFSFAQDIPKEPTKIAPVVKDNVVVSVDSLLVTETSERVQDTIVKDSIKPKKETLTDIVTYKATDYTSFHQKKKQLYLYNNAEITYGDINIKAGSITIDYSKNTVYAKGIIDSTNTYTQAPVFTQGANVVEPDSIIYNTKTEKALCNRPSLCACNLPARPTHSSCSFTSITFSRSALFILPVLSCTDYLYLCYSYSLPDFRTCLLSTHIRLY